MMHSNQVHPQALVECETIGKGSRVWAFAHVMEGASLGTDCNVGDHAFLETGSYVGNNVTIKNHVCIWEGIVIEDDVFLGPHVVFTNDKYPRSPRMSRTSNRYRQKETWLESTVVKQGSSIGANSTIMPGITLGAYSMIAAGSIVTRDVEPHALMAGSPARRVGTVCFCGLKTSPQTGATCPNCNATIADFMLHD
jgi:acetyltransferase-like isoleucine patch superfamily enzyme